MKRLTHEEGEGRRSRKDERLTHEGRGGKEMEER